MGLKTYSFQNNKAYINICSKYLTKMREKTENKILSLFAFNHKLKFNEIEDKLKEKSNKIAYHLKNLVKKRVLIKQEEYYMLSDNSEHLIPYLSDKNAILPVLLICIGNKNKSFLYKREKRPYKGNLSLPGGRILVGESMKQAVERMMRDKFNINARFRKIKSISLEHVRKRGKILHSFLLIFVSAETKDKISLTNVDKNKKQIIKSDYKLIKSSSDKEINIKIINSKI